MKQMQVYFGIKLINKKKNKLMTRYYNFIARHDVYKKLII